MRTITVSEQTTIIKLMRSTFPALSQGVLRRAFRQRDFRLNGARTSQDEPLMPGDVLAVYIDDRYLYPQVEIIYQDANIVVVNKRPGMPVEGEDSVTSVLGNQLNQPVYAAHRLDAPTGGLLVFACSVSVRDMLFAAFERRQVEKSYRCVVRGVFSPDVQDLTHYLKKHEQEGIVEAYDHPAPGAKTARLKAYLLAQDKHMALLEVALLTGRTHQIRVQMAHIGHPVLGDDRYGDRAWNRQEHARQLHLWSCKLHILVPEGPLAYLSEVPFEVRAPFEDFTKGRR